MSGALKYTLIVRDESGNPVALLAGEPVPDWAADLVHADDLEGGDESPTQGADDSGEGDSGGGESQGADQGGGEGSGEPPQAPAGNASTEAWQEYAKSQGASDADVEGKSRDELREQYGK